MSKLTAKTITDAQIRALYDAISTSPSYLTTPADEDRVRFRVDSMHECQKALEGSKDARARCAAMINAKSMRPTFPTGKLTDAEIAEGWHMCDDKACVPMLGDQRIVGPHAHWTKKEEA